MKKNGKAKVYSMKGGDTPRAELRPMLIDYPIQKDNIDEPIKNFAPVMQALARGNKKLRKTKSRKNRK